MRANKGKKHNCVAPEWTAQNCSDGTKGKTRTEIAIKQHQNQ